MAAQWVIALAYMACSSTGNCQERHFDLYVAEPFDLKAVCNETFNQKVKEFPDMKVDFVSCDAKMADVKGQKPSYDRENHQKPLSLVEKADKLAIEAYEKVYSDCVVMHQQPEKTCVERANKAGEDVFNEILENAR